MSYITVHVAPEAKNVLVVYTRMTPALRSRKI